MATLPADPFATGIAAFAEDLRAGRTSSVAATEACLARIEALEHRVRTVEAVRRIDTVL